MNNNDTFSWESGIEGMQKEALVPSLFFLNPCPTLTLFPALRNYAVFVYVCSCVP